MHTWKRIMKTISDKKIITRRVDMTEQERGEIITVLVVATNWNKAALEELSNRRLLEVYDSYLKAR